MAHGKWITDFEKDCIRIGKAAGLDNATIARALRRRPGAISAHVTRMTNDGTIGNLPLVFMVDDIAEVIRREGARK
ncbi:helix-turn-helix domain-containing protein [Thioclava dalianensis]|uniref:helix-turn-helix domain-containing protein n=1 Tax=Thioclava dalianensis TaxID=1185766 RepID=UPI0015A5B164|nr:hypothetical protein [Thioclava dalianensis]